MYTGYLAIGGDTLTDERFELINTDRVYAYAETWNTLIKQGVLTDGQPPTACIDWLVNCDSCPGYGDVFAPGLDYEAPWLDPAPWYDPNVEDSRAFLGLIGLGVDGAEDSTETAIVEQALGGGGAIGRKRSAARTLVVRALAVAVNGCGLEWGLMWLRNNAHHAIQDNCIGDVLWFLTCCPNCARENVEAPPIGPCWATSYAEVLGYPASCPVGTWWPETYQQLLDGPPDNTQWCRWIVSYTELRVGLPNFSCNVEDCIGPYVRQYQAVSVTEGPTVLSVRAMHKIGAIAEVEFTIVAADPAEYTPTLPVAALNTAARSGDPWSDPAAPPEPPTDPFTKHLLKRPPVSGPPDIALPTNWSRWATPFTVDPHSQMPDTLVPVWRIQATGEVDEVRVQVLQNGNLIGGFVLPYMPDGTEVIIDGRTTKIFTVYNGITSLRNGFARGLDGRPMRWTSLIDGDYELVVDKATTSVGNVIVDLSLANRAAG